MTLEQRALPASATDEASRVLAACVLDGRLSVFPDADAVPALQARAALLANLPGDFPKLSQESVSAAVQRLSAGRQSLAELKPLSLTTALLEGLSPSQREALRREAPEKIQFPSGRTVKVHYEAGKPPWIATRLQDFIGMTETPRICSGRVALVAHLLAPNGRPVQVTQDLTGFWQKHYPALRRQLQRRYPRHAWPDLP